EIADRPLPQIVIAVHKLSGALVGEVDEVGNLRSRGLIRVGKPDRFGGQFYSSALRWAVAIAVSTRRDEAHSSRCGDFESALRRHPSGFCRPLKPRLRR